MMPQQNLNEGLLGYLENIEIRKITSRIASEIYIREREVQINERIRRY